MAQARAIAVPAEDVIDVASAAVAGSLNGLMWRFLPMNAPIAILSTSGLAVASLMGSIWAREGVPAVVLRGVASGSAAVLGFVAPLLLGVGTAGRTGTRDRGKDGNGSAKVIDTKALPNPAGERVRERVSEFIELSTLS